MTDPRDLAWDLSPDNPMILEVKVRGTGQVLMRIFLGEAMEAAGQEAVMAHVAECDRSPWITSWHQNTNNPKCQVWQTISK